jgi:phosphatidylglycerol lysyltransferase
LGLRHGWNATAFQTLEGSYDYFFHDDGCVAYVDTGAAWVAAGPPIAASGNLLSIARAFVAAARGAGRRCCFFGGERRFLYEAGSMLRSMLIGELPVWDPGNWNDLLQRRTGLRRQLRRTRARGVRVRRLLVSDLATDDRRRAIEHLTSAWLASRRMPAMGFLVGMGVCAFSEHRHCFIAERSGSIVALAYVIPVPQRDGWVVEHLVRGPHTPNGSIELLIDVIMHWAAKRRSPWLTLGLTPLSGEVALPLRIARERMSFLYNFTGLRHFRAKLGPKEWLPVHLSFPTSQGPVMTCIDVLTAFAKQPNRGGARAALPSMAAIRRMLRASVVAMGGLLGLEHP